MTERCQNPECGHKALRPDGGWPQCIRLGGTFWFHWVYCDGSFEVAFLPADALEGVRAATTEPFDDYPKPVSEMDADEYAIMQVASEAIGRLHFIRDALARLPGGKGS